MARPRKERQLTAPEKAQSDKIASYFTGIVFPEKMRDRTDALNTQIHDAAKRLYLDLTKERAQLSREERKDKEKYPPIKSYHFPNFACFASFMVVSSEDSLETWKKRFASGK